MINVDTLMGDPEGCNNLLSVDGITILIITGQKVKYFVFTGQMSFHMHAR